MFLVDTNILVDASRRYYGFDFVPSFWEFMDDQFEVPQVLFRLSRWENLEHAEEV